MKNLTLILALFCFLSCSDSNTVEWAFPLHGSEKHIEVELPTELEDYKVSIHTSDCKSCGLYQTVFSKKKFLKRIQDTTGFFSPWRIDSTANWYLYFDVQLNKDTFLPAIIPNFKKELSSIESSIFAIDKNAEITSKIFDDNIALVSYERRDHNRLKMIKGIDGLTFLDSTWIGIHYEQYDSLDNGLTESLMKCLSRIKIK